MDAVTLSYLLIVVGLVLLVAEVFLYTHGVLAVLGVVALFVGVTVAFGVDSYRGLWTLIGVGGVLPLILALWLFVWPRTPLGRRFFLPVPPPDDTLANSPTNVELEQLRGRFGKTLSALRPSGVALFDGRRVDSMSEGALIGPDQWVQCVEVRNGAVIVRPVQGPPNLENLDTTDLHLG
jgi:membrane-bound ClpP family serine protease